MEIFTSTETMVIGLMYIIYMYLYSLNHAVKLLYLLSCDLYIHMRIHIRYTYIK